MSKTNRSILESPEKNAEIHSNAILETPNLIVLWMISLIPDSYFISDKTTFFDPACGRGTFLKYVYVKLRQHGHSHQNAIGRIFGVDKYSSANETSDIFPNIIKKDFLKMDFPSNWPKRFSIALCNPPYKANVDLKFLDKCLDLAEERVVFVHPGAYAIQKKNTYKKFIQIRERLNPVLEYIELFNGNGIFEIGLFIPCVITSVNLKKSGGKIKVKNRLTGDSYKVDRIEKILAVKNSPLFWTIKEKIDNLVRLNGSIDSIVNKKAEKEYLVEFSRIRGSVDTSGGIDDPLYGNGHFTFIKKDLECAPGKPIEFDMWMWFDSLSEGENAIFYLKSDIARFCLAIYKFAQSINGGEMRFVPKLNFMLSKTEEEINQEFGLTTEEISYIRQVIKPYYQKQKNQD